MGESPQHDLDFDFVLFDYDRSPDDELSLLRLSSVKTLAAMVLFEVESIVALDRPLQNIASKTPYPTQKEGS